ncbi:ABC transporter ATP-binding protein [Lachnospiraceae bacterium 38-10]
MLLEVKDLVVKYGEITALSGINIQAEEGQLTTLIGSNGAGKTTLLKALSGLHKPASGKIIFDGNDITESSTDKIVTLGISHCPEGRRVFPRQSVIENLRMGAFIRKDKEIEEDIKKYFQWFPRLEERKNQKAGLLSGGEQQMLAISRALMSRPKLLLLDEPSMGLAPLVVEEVFKIIDEVHRQGTTIFLVEQNARQALKIADKGYVLEVGKITASDSAENLLNSEDVKKAYLGA